LLSSFSLKGSRLIMTLPPVSLPKLGLLDPDRDVEEVLTIELCLDLYREVE
jgi:hypothetical protein